MVERTYIIRITPKSLYDDGDLEEHIDDFINGLRLDFELESDVQLEENEI